MQQTITLEPVRLFTPPAWARRWSIVPPLLTLPIAGMGIYWLYLAVKWWATFVETSFLGTDPAMPERLLGSAHLNMPDYWTVGLRALLAVAGLTLVLVSLLGQWRSRWVLRLIRIACLFNVPVFFAYAIGVVMGESAFAEAMLAEGGDAVPATNQVFWHSYVLLFDSAVLSTVLFALAMLAGTQTAKNVYSPAPSAHDTTTEFDTERAVGDRFFESLRTHGRDPQYRKSNHGSTFVHVLVLIIIPWLISMYGCIEPYRIPHGSGSPAVLKVVQVQVVQKKKVKYLLNPNSPIIFKQPDIEDSEILKEVEKATELTYEATTPAEGGALGEGGGDKGGWPDGVPGGELRFIRLEYRGQNWDDGMGAAGADTNLLAELKSLVPFPVRKYGESHPVGHLARYPRGQAPPFVYMTGSGSISLSDSERRTLREYCIEGGGLLFADAGSARFHSSFEHLMRQVFPDKRLVELADDDPVFRMPFVFPNGAPPMWFHGGKVAKGIRHNGRLIVFYHPGDLNDAWKVGRSGATLETARASMHMAINIVYYAVTNYLHENRKYLK